MLITIEGVYKKGTIELTETPVAMEEARVLVTFLPTAPPVSHPKDLYGVWKASMPATLDVEEAIKTIRTVRASPAIR